jgi:hypothetical protein
VDGNPLAFRSDPEPTPDVEIRVNFGMFAGREATRAEIDDLARELLGVVSHVTVESVRRHELDREGEALVHQVKVEASEAAAHAAGGDRRPLGDQLLEVVESWARRTIEERHAETADVEALP